MTLGFWYVQVLWWGIWTAAVLRCVFIAAGSTAIEHFSGVLLFFAGLLLYSSYKILRAGDDDDSDDLSENVVIKYCR